MHKLFVKFPAVLCIRSAVSAFSPAGCFFVCFGRKSAVKLRESPIYVYDDVSLIGNIFVTSSGKIAVNEKTYSIKNSEQFIEQIIEIMEQVH